jgi:hypothetical protein
LAVATRTFTVSKGTTYGVGMCINSGSSTAPDSTYFVQGYYFAF